MNFLVVARLVKFGQAVVFVLFVLVQLRHHVLLLAEQLCSHLPGLGELRPPSESKTLGCHVWPGPVTEARTDLCSRWLRMSLARSAMMV